MTKGKDLEGHFIWPFLAASIYMYIHSASEKYPTENGLYKCEGGGWSVLTTYIMYSRDWFCSPGLPYNRQTDRYYLPTYYPLTKRCSVIAK